MSQDKEREAFEAWAHAQGYEVQSRKPDGRYWSSHTHGVWEAWQARAAHGITAAREASLRQLECPPDPEAVDRALLTERVIDAASAAMGESYRDDDGGLSISIPQSVAEELILALHLLDAARARGEKEKT